MEDYKSNDRPVVYFDGVCNLCNGAVQFIIRHDKKQQFLFASLQSSHGEVLQKDFQLRGMAFPESIILHYGNAYYSKADAIIKIARLLGGPWQAAGIFNIIPRFIRNRIYDFIARRRYRWFGKKDSCYMPTPELNRRFLD